MKDCDNCKKEEEIEKEEEKKKEEDEEEKIGEEDIEIVLEPESPIKISSEPDEESSTKRPVEEPERETD